MKNIQRLVLAGLAMTALQQTAVAVEKPANDYPGHAVIVDSKTEKLNRVMHRHAPQSYMAVTGHQTVDKQAPVNGVSSDSVLASVKHKSAQAGACTPEEFSVLTGTALVDATKSADKVNCIYNLYGVAGGTLAKQLFSAAKMTTIANAITAIDYDGTASSGILNLINYLRAGYYVQYAYPADLPPYSAAVRTAMRAALDKFFSSPSALTISSENGEILNEFLIAIDSSSDIAHYLPRIRDVIVGSSKLWLDTTNMANAGLQAQNLYYYTTWDSDANAAFQANPSLASDLLTYYNINKSVFIGGVNAKGSPTDWYIVNVIGEYARLLQFSSVHALIKPNVIAIVDSLNLDKVGELQTYIRLGTITNNPNVIPSDESCDTYHTCGFAAKAKDRVLTIKYTCPTAPSVNFHVQAMSDAELTTACNSVANEVALFHSKLGTNDNDPVAGDFNNHIEMDIFNNSTEYKKWAGALFGISTDNGGMYLEGEPSDVNNQPRFIAYEKTWTEAYVPDGLFYIWNLTHEFTHYLDGRFVKKGNYDDGFNYQMVWYAEGLAEYIAYTYEGRYNYRAIAAMQAHPEYSLSYLFQTPTSPWDQDRVYSGGWAAQSFLFAKHPEIIQTIVSKLRAGDYPGYANYINGLGTSLDAEFAAFWPTLIRKPLVRNIPQTQLSAAEGADLIYAFNVPVGTPQVKFETSLGHGNVDLTVKAKATPTDTDNDCVSQTAANRESCVITAPSPGTYYIRLHAKKAFSGVQLLASHSVVVSKCSFEDVTVLAQNCYRIVHSAQGLLNLYVRVPTGGKNLRIRLSGGTGEVDLYFGYHARPTTTTYDAKSTNVGNAELITIDTPTAGWNYIAIDAKQAVKQLKVATLYDY